MLLAFILATSLPNWHPDAPIGCVEYMPNSDIRVPAGVTFGYSPSQWRDNQMRCFCEVVKPLESMCIRSGYNSSQCKSRTTRWVDENFQIVNPGNNQNQEGEGQNERRNFILNIRSRF